MKIVVVEYYCNLIENNKKVSLRCLLDKCPPVLLNYRQRIN